MIINTIGFAKKSLAQFIELLQEANVEIVIDSRLNNTSQLAGYAKRDDLKYILNLVGIKYEHCLEMAPTEELLKGIKKGQIPWDEFEDKYLNLLKKRKVESLISDDGKLFNSNNVCILCSEHEENQCHRKLLSDYLSKYIVDFSIRHLK